MATTDQRAALTSTVLKGKPRPAKLQHVVWSSIEAEELNPLLFRSFVVGKNVMVARMFLKKGSLFRCTAILTSKSVAFSKVR